MLVAITQSVCDGGSVWNGRPVIVGREYNTRG